MATPSKTPPGADPKQLERTGTVREIGSQAVWSLSSCKPGNPPHPQNPTKHAVSCVHSAADGCNSVSEVCDCPFGAFHLNFYIITAL